MTIQTQDRQGIVNSDLMTCAALMDLGDKWGIGTELLASSQILGLGEYSTKERAQYELDNLITAFARDAKVYVMPEE